MTAAAFCEAVVPLDSHEASELRRESLPDPEPMENRESIDEERETVEEVTEEDFLWPGVQVMMDGDDQAEFRSASMLVAETMLADLFASFTQDG